MEPIVDEIQECPNMELELQEIDSQSNMTTIEVADDVLERLKEKFSGGSSSSPDYRIFRVHDHLRKVNEVAYEPEIVAIGPYHRNKVKLKMIKELKLRYLNSQIKKAKKDLKVFLAEMRSLEDIARQFYAEDLSSLSANEFTEMMLLDGCFIIGLFMQESKDNDSILKLRWIFSSLQRDLMLFENQIPFFVLRKLFDMIEGPGQHHMLIERALEFFKQVPFRLSDHGNSSDKIDHLLGLIHSNCLPSFKEGISNENSAGNKVSLRLNCMPLARTESIENRRFSYCATSLSEAGVKFEKITEGSLSDIKFERGKLQIIPLTIDGGTECFLRNMIAYEQYCPAHIIMFVTDYVSFLDWLIDTSKDVEILSRSGIIDNWLGDDEVVATMINKILDSTTCPVSKYAEIFKQVNFYCSKQCNPWMAKLRRNYLNTPWGVISVLAASVLLLFTVIQTIFTIFPRK